MKKQKKIGRIGSTHRDEWEYSYLTEN
jgi:hypothetical protein